MLLFPKSKTMSSLISQYGYNIDILPNPFVTPLPIHLHRQQHGNAVVQDLINVITLQLVKTPLTVLSQGNDHYIPHP